ncbi:MAG TPA: H-X9-DG-CTERM domain-containing protein [Abditibacteriaceae bacterium]
MSVAFNLYVADYDNKYPPTSRFQGQRLQSGWLETMFPYLRCGTCRACPAEVTPPTDSRSQRGYSDYWFNANLYGVRKEKLAYPDATLLSGDGNDGTDKSDANYNIARFPDDWLSDKTKPPLRHMGGANYIFADGHIAWLTPEEAARPDGKHDGFAVR